MIHRENIYINIFNSRIQCGLRGSAEVREIIYYGPAHKRERTTAIQPFLLKKSEKALAISKSWRAYWGLVQNIWNQTNFSYIRECFDILLTCMNYLEMLKNHYKVAEIYYKIRKNYHRRMLLWSTWVRVQIYNKIRFIETDDNWL